MKILDRVWALPLSIHTRHNDKTRHTYDTSPWTYISISWLQSHLVAFFPLGFNFNLSSIDQSIFCIRMGSSEPSLEEFPEEKKRVRNPLVPVGALITAGVLTAGLISFRRGNSHLGQQLMRARVVVQGATVALMVGTAFYYGDNPWRSS